MTGFISAVIGNTVEVLSDTAIYDQNGLVLDFETKVHRLSPHLPAVVFTRGDVDAGEDIEDAIAAIFARADSIDEAISTLANHMALRKLPGMLVPLDVTIGAISEGNGPQLYTFQTQRFSGRPAWTLRTSTRGFANGVEHGEVEHKAMVIAGLTKLAPFLMTELRKAPGVSLSFPGATNAVIGGSIELTTVSSHNATTSTLHVWPDKVGRRLMPLPEDRCYLLSAFEFSRAIQGKPSSLAETPPTLNRHARKAAAAKARRAA